MPVQLEAQQMIDLVDQYKNERDQLVANLVVRNSGGQLNYRPLFAMHDRYTRQAESIAVGVWGPIQTVDGVDTLGNGEAWRDLARAADAVKSAKTTIFENAMSASEYVRAKDRAASLMTTVNNSYEFREMYREAEENVQIVLQEAHGQLVKHTSGEWAGVHNWLERERRNRTDDPRVKQAQIEQIAAGQAVEAAYQATLQLADAFAPWNGRILGFSPVDALRRQGMNPATLRVQPQPVNLEPSHYLTALGIHIIREVKSVEIDGQLIAEYRFAKNSNAGGRIRNWQMNGGRITSA